MQGFLVRVMLTGEVEGRGGAAVAVLADSREDALRTVMNAGPENGWVASTDAIAISQSTILALGLVIDKPKLL